MAGADSIRKILGTSLGSPRTRNFSITLNVPDFYFFSSLTAFTRIHEYIQGDHLSQMERRNIAGSFASR